MSKCLDDRLDEIRDDIRANEVRARDARHDLADLADRLDSHIAEGGHAPECEEPEREWPKTLGEMLVKPQVPEFNSARLWTNGWNAAADQMHKTLARYGLLNAPIETGYGTRAGSLQLPYLFHENKSYAVIAVPWERDKDC